MNYRKTLNTDEELAAWYEAKYKEMGGGWQTPEWALAQHATDAQLCTPGVSILDVGCGDGTFVDLLRLNGADKTWGFDLVKPRSPNCYQGNICDRRDVVMKMWNGHGYDRVFSLGSLEHVTDIDRALNFIHFLLVPDGRWYFFVPNELWVHTDQPNERTATDDEWEELFLTHGLLTDFRKRWNDSTAFGGTRS